MPRYLALLTGIVGVSLLLFFGAERAHVELLVAPERWMTHAGPAAAALSLALLASDIVLPVPSSIVMALNGLLFGVAAGAALSVVGTLGATMLGFAIGRRGSGAIHRYVGPREEARAAALLARWGLLAIVVTRPIPLLAESVAILAGASPLGAWRVAAAGLLGSLPPALVYALAGATHASAAGQGLVFLGVIAAAGLLWALGRRNIGAAAGVADLDDTLHRARDGALHTHSHRGTPMARAIWNGTIIAESDATRVVEGNHYFPPDAVRREHLAPSETHTTCGWKGEASYYDLVVGDAHNRDAAWYYPEPKEAASEIAGYVAFWKGVRVEP